MLKFALRLLMLYSVRMMSNLAIPTTFMTMMMTNWGQDYA
jgi:hypothetical protein